MEYLICIINIYKCILEWGLTIISLCNKTNDCFLLNTEIIKNLAEIIAIIAGSGIFIKGYKYIKALKEKKVDATFGFWSHLAVKLLKIKSRLSENHNLINNLYDTEIRNDWANEGAPPTKEEMELFKKSVGETFLLIETEVDQLPAYNGWTDDYMQVIAFLDDVLHYDIADASKGFKFYKTQNQYVSIEERDKFCYEICETIDNVIIGIKKTQKEVEAKLYS